MRKHGEIYLHVGNSGATFSVIDEGFGPTVRVQWGAFGNLGSELKVHTTVESLEELGKLFTEAATKSFSEPHVHAADTPELRKKRPRDSAKRG